MKHFAKFNPDVAVRILSTVGANQGLPVQMMHEPLTKVINQMYQLGFMVCGDPASPQVQSVASQYGVPLHAVARVQVPVEAPRALHIPAAQTVQQLPVAPMPEQQPLPALNPAVSPIAGDAPSV